MYHFLHHWGLMITNYSWDQRTVFSPQIRTTSMFLPVDSLNMTLRTSRFWFLRVFDSAQETFMGKTKQQHNEVHFSGQESCFLSSDLLYHSLSSHFIFEWYLYHNVITHTFMHFPCAFTPKCNSTFWQKSGTFPKAHFFLSDISFVICWISVWDIRSFSLKN